MRIRGALAALLAASAWAQSKTLTVIEADLAKKVEQAAVADSAFSDLVTRLTENQYHQGQLSKARQTLRSAIARAENEGQRAVAFGLRMRLSDDLTEAGMFAEAFAETRAAEAGAGGVRWHREWVMRSYANCGECEEARRIERSLPANPGVGRSVCGGIFGHVVPAATSTKFTPRPGTPPADELGERLGFARSIVYRGESAALDGHLEETVAFAERNGLKAGAAELADFLATHGDAGFETYADRVLQLAGPDPAVVESFADAWLQRTNAGRARALFEQSRTIRLSKDGPWSMTLLRPLEGLERAAAAVRDWRAAIGYSREAAHILEFSGPQSRALSEHLLNSAERFHAGGQAETARQLWDRGLALAEGAYGPLSRRFAQTLEGVGKASGRVELGQRAKGIHARFPDPEACWRARRAGP